MKGGNYLIISIVLLVLAYLLLPPRHSQTMKTQEHIQAQSEGPSTVKERINVQSSTRSTRSVINEKEIQQLRDSFPEDSDVKKEVERDPHSTPKSLSNFAKIMGQLMERSIQNEEDASMLIGELKRCALDESIALSARALCVTNAERVAENHSQLKSQMTELRADISPEVNELLQKRSLFIKKFRDP
jgi:predicted phage tail protein